MIDVSDRHPSVQDIVRLLDSQHLTDDTLAQVSRVFENAASQLLALLPDGPRLTAALNDLWTSKNNAVGHLVCQRDAPPVTLAVGEVHATP